VAVKTTSLPSTTVAGEVTGRPSTLAINVPFEPVTAKVTE